MSDKNNKKNKKISSENDLTLTFMEPWEEEEDKRNKRDFKKMLSEYKNIQRGPPKMMLSHTSGRKPIERNKSKYIDTTSSESESFEKPAKMLSRQSGRKPTAGKK